MNFLHNLFSKKRSKENKVGDATKIFMDQAKKLVKETNTSKYLGPGGFGSVKEIEVSFFIALVADMTSMNDQEIFDLVERSYGLDETKTRQLIREFRNSRK